MKRLQVISNSEVGVFRSCRARWGFEYHGMLRPRVPARVMTWGNAIHAGVEGGYLAAFAWPYRPGADVAKEAAAAAVDVYHGDYVARLDEMVDAGHVQPEQADELWSDSNKMLRVAKWACGHYFDATADDMDRLVPLGFEVPFRVPVYNAAGRASFLWLTGKIDGLWWDPETQQVVVDDLKTTDELHGTTEKRIAMDPQLSGYMHAARHMLRAGTIGPLDGTQLPPTAADRIGSCRYNVIRRSMPRAPSVNKVRKNDGLHTVTQQLADREKATGESHGLVSTAAIDTTADVYDRALLDQVDRGLQVTDKQRALLERLRQQGDRYFARFAFWRTAEDLARWRDELWTEARLMRSAERSAALRTRNPGQCTQANSLPCAYRPVCMDDTDETRALYRVAGSRHEEVDHGDQRG